MADQPGQELLLQGQVEQRLQNLTTKAGGDIATAKGVLNDLLQPLPPTEQENEQKEPQILAVKVDKAESAGTNIIKGLAESHKDWRQRIDHAIEAYTQVGRTDEAKVLQALRKELPQAVAQELGQKEVEGIDLSSELRSYISERLLARLTDPAREKLLSRKGGRINEVTREEEELVKQDLGLDARSDLFQKGRLTEADPYGKREVNEAYIQKQREKHLVYTQAQVARFLQGRPVQIETTDDNKNRKTLDFKLPAGVTDEEKQRYAHILAGEIDSVDNFLQANYAKLAERYRDDPAEIFHDRFTSGLFMGITYGGEIISSQDTGKLIGTKAKPLTESFTRGASIRAIAEGRNVDAYVNALTVIPKEKDQRASSLYEMWKTVPPKSEIKRALSEMLIIAHGEQIQKENQNLFDEITAEVGGNNRVEQIQNEFLERQMDQVTSEVKTGVTNEFFKNLLRNPAERLTGEMVNDNNATSRRDAGEKLARGILAGQIVSEDARMRMTTLGTQYKEGKLTAADFCAQAKALVGGSVSTENIEVSVYETHSYPGEQSKKGGDIRVDKKGEWQGSEWVGVEQVTPMERPAAFKAKFVQELLEPAGGDQVPNTQKVEQFFLRAENFGVNRQELVRIYNETTFSLNVAKRLLDPLDNRGKSFKFHDCLNYIGGEITGVFPGSFVYGEGFNSYEVPHAIDRKSERRKSEEGFWTYFVPNSREVLPEMSIRSRVESDLKPVVDQARQLIDQKILLKNADGILPDGSSQGSLLAETADSVNSRKGMKDQHNNPPPPEIQRARTEASKISSGLNTLERVYVPKLRTVSTEYTDMTRLIAHLRADYADAAGNQSGFDKFRRKPVTLPPDILISAENKLKAYLPPEDWGWDINSASGIASVQAAIESAHKTKQADLEKEMKGHVEGLVKQVPTVDERVIKYLQNRTKPPYDGTNPNHSIDTIAIPLKQFMSNIPSEKSINPTKEDFDAGGLLIGLGDVFYLTEAELAPIQQRVQQLTTEGRADSDSFSAEITQLLVSLGNKVQTPLKTVPVLMKYVEQMLAVPLKDAVKGMNVDSVASEKVVSGVLGKEIVAAFQKQAEVLAANRTRILPRVA